MDLGLRDKSAFVGGASKGLGRATALVLAREGVRLAIAARDATLLEATATDALAAGAPDVVAFALDLTDGDALRGAVHATADRYGAIDLLVNNVGGPERPYSSGFLSLDDAAWVRAFETVLLIAVRTCREVIPLMLANGGGAIVNVSGQAIRQHIPIMGHHEALKAAVAHMTKSLAKEFAPTVRVNAVLPGAMTDPVHRREVLEPALAANGWTEADYMDDLSRKYYEMSWSRRPGDAEEVADVIAFLLSDRAGYVNGAWVNIDGGSSPG